MPSPAIGDMDSRSFEAAGQMLLEWAAEYLQNGDRYPVLPGIEPGSIRGWLPAAPPARGESIDVIFEDFRIFLLPGITHWNQPGFLGYFASSGSGPGVLGELLTAVLNQQAMLWTTSPAATELEEVVLDWLRQLLGVPAAFEGTIFDGGSTSNLHALAAAVAHAIPDAGERGIVARAGVPPLCVYASEEAHSSIDKAMMVLGLGRRALRRIPVDDCLRMRTPDLAAAIRADRIAGRQPLAVVATVGTTSTSSIDPVGAIADICEREQIWLHVDAAYGGAAAIVPGQAWVFDGVARADSFVVNPHKWLFTPLDLSTFYCRHRDTLRRAFALTPEYLRTDVAGDVRNLMDSGIPLGRRFRALKLWMVLRYFGADGLRARIAHHIELAKAFAGWIDGDPEFERLAPVPLSVVCFRAVPPAIADDAAGLDAFNAELLAAVNASGDVFLSHARVNGRYALRLAIGHIRTDAVHVQRAWTSIRETAARLQPV